MLKVNGHVNVGVLVVAKEDEYNIRAESKDNISIAWVRTCHRDVNPDETEKHYFEYKYVPSIQEEKNDLCTIHLGVFDSKKGRHYYGLIILEDPMGVPAEVYCNGGIYKGKTSGCQSGIGLVQQIEFKQGMLATKDTPCDYQLDNTSGRIFKYVMPKGECNLTFVNTEGTRTHRHVSVGFESSFIRDK